MQQYLREGLVEWTTPIQRVLDGFDTEGGGGEDGSEGGVIRCTGTLLAISNTTSALHMYGTRQQGRVSSTKSAERKLPLQSS